ncbi:inter-alpha-trypsin inhibitor heavy chain H2-like [Elysia marginata]|uniref:Inter-alpha-trypsin inhibitor heavy chain H2-like n=1 Tax=Elysia marginata TaxID=1093978 RepID=A0AAV4GVC5_9GAST|nr:inter-alpha-trypsin inhibitor heavy chain H2-like [Elysia marginata]
MIIINNIIKRLQLRTRVKYNFAKTNLELLVENTGHSTQALGFDVSLLKDEFITNLYVTVDGIKWKTSFQNRSAQEIDSRDALDLATSVLHLNMASESNYGTLYQIAVNVPPKKTADFRFESLRLLERRQNKYKLDVYVSFEVSVERLMAYTGLYLANGMGTDRVETTEEQDVEDITDKGDKWFMPEMNLSQWRYYDVMVPSDKTLKWTVRYSVQRMNKLGRCGIDYDGHFVHLVNVMNQPEVPKDVIFVLDNSGSMFGDKMKKLRQAMGNVIDNMKYRWNTNAKYTVIMYGGYLRQSWVGLKSTQYYTSRAKNFINRKVSQGMSDIKQALSHALDVCKSRNTMDRKRSPVRMIIFLTDGVPSKGETRTENIVRFITTKNKGDCSIFSLAYGKDADLHFLNSLSINNFGFVRKIYETEDAAIQIEKAVKEIISVTLKEMKVEYQNGITKHVSTPTHPFTLSQTEYLITGRVKKGRSATFYFQVEGRKGRTGTMWKSIKLPCAYESHIHSAVKHMWVYQRLRKLMWERDLVAEKNVVPKNVKIARIKEFSLENHFVTPYTTFEIEQPEIRGNSHQLVRLHQVDLGYMVPVDFSILKPFYRVDEADFPHISGPRVASTPAFRHTRTNKIAHSRGTLNAMTLEIVPTSPFFTTTRSVCVAAYRWQDGGIYKLFQDEPNGVIITLWQCMNKKKCGKQKLEIKHRNKTLIVELGRTPKWSTFLKPHGHKFGLQEEKRKGEYLFLEEYGRVRVEIYKNLDPKISKMNYELKVKLLPVYTFPVRNLSGLLGNLATRDRDDTDDSNKANLCSGNKVLYLLRLGNAQAKKLGS